MKKIAILSIALMALSFASCKKDRTCTCKDASGGEVKKISKITKKQALSNCQSRTLTQAGTTGNGAEDCTLSK